MGCNCNCNREHKSSSLNYWDIIHWTYPYHMAAKEGYGIVLDNRLSGHPFFNWKNNFPILGWMEWKDTIYPEADGEVELYCRIRLSKNDWTKDWSIVKHPTIEILETIKYATYVIHKYGRMDNLSLVEILNKLKEYEHSTRIS